MSKQAGLLMGLFVEGVDLSGDIGIVDQLASPRGTQDVTGMNSVLVERRLLLADGNMSFSAYWNTAAGQAHATLDTMPMTDINAMVVGPALGAALAVGDPACCLLGKQIDYAPSRGADGSLLAKVQVQANGQPLDWGVLLTIGKQTIASTAAGTALDFGATTYPAIAITSSSVANPTHVITAAPHGLVTGDTVLIAGHTGSTPALNNAYIATVVNATEFTVAVNVTVGGTGGTVTQTSTHNGGTAYLQAFSVGSGSATVAVQDSSDNAAWADVTGLVFAAVTAKTDQQLVLGSTAVIRRYVRLNVTGVFTNLVVAVALCRRQASF